MAEKETKKSNNFYQGTGRRKTAVARVRLILGKGELTMGEKPLFSIFSDELSKKTIQAPFQTVSRMDSFRGTVKIAGGGIAAQTEAIALGIARALVDYDETLRAPLSKAGLLRRDPRMRESRKYGLAGKARRGKQSPKR